MKIPSGTRGGSAHGPSEEEPVGRRLVLFFMLLKAMMSPFTDTTSLLIFLSKSTGVLRDQLVGPSFHR